MSITKDDFINFMNDLYHLSLSDLLTLQRINTYKTKYKHQKEDLLNWLKDDKIIFNHSERAYITKSAEHVINNKLPKFYDYVGIAKEYLFKKIINNKIKIKNPLLKAQFEWLYGDKDGKYNMLEVNSFYELGDYERLENVNDSVQYICYNLLSTKGYNSSLIFYSYICYFKCAINCIIHNPVFKYMLKLDSDKPPSYEKLQRNKYYSFIEYVQRGGSELWELLKCNKDIFDIVDFYNNLTRSTYLIGRPGVKYYPHQILQELLYYINNSFSASFYYDYHFVQIINELKYDMDKEIEEILNKCNLDSVFIAPILDNPFKNYVLPIGTSAKEIIDEIRKYPNKSIDDILKDDAEIKTKETTNNNKVYKYKYLVGKYYLSSFCIIENIPKSNISFHCVFIQLKYDYDFNIIGINRYDDKKINYLFKENELTEHYLPYERAIFNKDYINDYYENCNYDNSHNYKVCLLCYTKKRFERVNLILK